MGRFQELRTLSLSAIAGLVVAGGLVAASAPSATADTGGPEHDSGEVETKGPQDCITYLENWGYEVGAVRTVACIGASTAPPSSIAPCIGALRVTDVRFRHAIPACTLGALP